MIFKRDQFVSHKDTKRLAESRLSQTKALRNNKTWCLGALVVKRKGMTLTEMAIVIGIIAVMVGLTLPVANVLYNSFETQNGAKAMINAALFSAKSIAIKEHRYAGIRFQKRYDPANPNPLNQSQYMIFIVSDKVSTLSDTFVAVDGIQPIKLPDSIGVTDLTLVQRSYVAFKGYLISESSVVNDSQIDSLNLSEITSFSIIFSPSGKLIIHRISVRNRDGYTVTASNLSNDDIFNRISQIEAGYGLFLQDDYFAAYYTPSSIFVPDYRLGPEYSRNQFYIYDTRKFKQAYNSGKPYSGYLNQLQPVYLNPYMGTIVEQ